MPNKTISVPDDVIPIIEGLDVPFSRWVTIQLRRHAAQSAQPFAEQLLEDAAVANEAPAGPLDPAEIGRRMGRAAPW